MDRFDDMWKNRFNEEELPKGDWNTPDDLVWDAVASEIATPKKKRKWLWLWFVLGLTFLSLIVFLTQNNNSKLGEALENNTKESSASPKILKINELENDQLTGAVESNDIEKSTANYLASNIIKPSTSIVKNKISLTPNRPAAFKKNSLNYFFKNPMDQNNLSRNIIQTNNQTTEGVFLKRTQLKQSIVKIPFIKKPVSSSNRYTPSLIFKEPIILFSNNDDSNSRWSVGFHTGLSFWKHRISDSYTDDLSPFDFNYNDSWGWQTNLKVNYHLSDKIDLFAGLQYERLTTQSGHNSDLSYNLDDENNPTNPFNVYVLSLATPYGLANANFNFNRTQSLNANEVELGVNFHSEHLIQNVSLPIGSVFYPLGKNQKLSPSLVAGLGINYLVSIDNRIDRIETNHDAIAYDDSGTSSFVKPNVNQLHFDYRLGVGVNYALNKSIQLQLNYDWSRGINPIFQQDNYKTFIDRHHLLFGLTKMISQ